MSTRLFVMVSRKVQPRSYHSNGAACGLKVEIPVAALDNPEAFVRDIRAHMGLCELAVEEELKRLNDAHPGTPTQTLNAEVDGKDQLSPPAARPTFPPRRADGQSVGSTAPPARRFDPPSAIPPVGSADEFNEGNDDQADDQEEEDPPTDGRQLLGWARKQTPDLKSWVISWGYKSKTKGNVVDWPEAKVTQCYTAARAALRAKKVKGK